MKEVKTIFSEDYVTDKTLFYEEKETITDYAAILSDDVSDEIKKKGDMFAQEITDLFVSDFEKSEELLKQGKVDEKDLMAHVSTFLVINGTIYTTYYANTKDALEDPNNQIARFVYCPVDDVDNKTFVDIQAVGDMCGGKKVTLVYDTILMQKDERTLYILWTAEVGGNYYRLYRIFDMVTKELSEVGVNRLKIGNVTNDFSATGIQRGLAANGLKCKKMYSDIGIMQKISSRVENGETYYYTGAYSGDLTFIIKSKDFELWEYVAQPDFVNESQWENATYVIGDKCYYFVRQYVESKYSFLTVYDLVKETWEKPVLIADSQSRGDFIEYKGDLYIVHAPIDRDHIGFVKVNKDDISKSEIVLQAKMHTSCFYPFLHYFGDELAMSYTIERKHIRLAKFTLSKYTK